jgi:hypothetical protein
MEVGVSFSVYDITVPVMVHGLNVMDDYLDHAQALERTKGFEPGKILGERLGPDMLAFRRTVLRKLQQGRGAHGEVDAARPASTPQHPDDVSGIEGTAR